MSIHSIHEQIFEENRRIKDRIGNNKFFAVEIDPKGQYHLHVPEYIYQSEVIYGCELLKKAVMG